MSSNILFIVKVVDDDYGTFCYIEHRLYEINYSIYNVEKINEFIEVNEKNLFDIIFTKNKTNMIDEHGIYGIIKKVITKVSESNNGEKLDTQSMKDLRICYGTY